ncbi:MAG: SURF1 family protein [Sneathiellaceae bacterium]
MSLLTRILGSPPALVPTLITLPSLVVLIVLGTWQMERLAWKSDLLDRIHERMAGPAEPLPQGELSPAAWEYRRVTVTGRYLPAQEFHLLATSPRGNAGFHVITPLQRADDGELLLIDRGWVPAERKAPEQRPGSGPPEGEVQVTGVVRKPWPQGWFVADNDVAGNLWFWPDLAAMGAALGRPVEPYMVEVDAREDPETVFPMGGQTRVNIPNNHLEYALTWYGFAVALAVIYLLWHRRRGQEAQRGEQA